MIPRSGRSTGEEKGYPLQYSWASLVAQMVKNLPAMQEALCQSLGWNGYPLQRTGLENSMDCIVRGVAKSQRRPIDFHFHTLLVGTSWCCILL